MKRKKELGYCQFTDVVEIRFEQDGETSVCAGWNSVRTRDAFEIELNEFANDEGLEPVGGISIFRLDDGRIVATQAFKNK